MLVPWAVLTVVTAMMWRSIFDPTLGLVNLILGTNIVWLGEAPQAMIVMILADVVEDGAVHGAAAARRVAGDTGGDL